jgi:uncharacterized membrane protein
MSKIKEDLSTVATEELKKRAKVMKIAVIFIGASVVLTAISGIILATKKGFSAINVIPISFLPMVIIFGTQLKKINEELKKRVV